MECRVWRCAWRTRDDHAGRHDDGDARGSRARDEGRHCASCTLMNKADVIKQIREIGIIPVVRATSADEAFRAIDAIREGGISVREITMTVPNAFSVIEQVTTRFGSDALVGAGTVLDAEDAKSCIASGAKFIVSPAPS